MNPPLTSREIETRLDTVRSIIRSTQRSRALFLIITTAIGGLLLAMLLDFAFSPLPAAARWVIFTLWVASVLGVALRALSPLRRKIPLVRIARWLEERHPEMQERLSTVIELAASPGGVSQELLSEIARAAGNDITSVDPKLEVRSARSRRQWKAPALFVTAVLMLALAAWPGQVWRLLVRTLAPFSDVGTVGAVRFTIKPGNVELLEDAPLHVSFTVSGKNPRPQVRISTLGGIETTQAAEVDGDGFRFTLAPVRESLRYQVIEGRDVSDTFNATVLPVPALSNTRAKLRFPAYTGLPESGMDPARGIEAVAGTVVTLTASLNTPVEAAWIEQEGNRICEGRIQPFAGGGTLAFEWELSGNTSGKALLVLKHRLRARIEAAAFEVKVLDDMPPQVVVLSPKERELRIRPAETLRLRHEITEDYAVAGLSLDAEVPGGTAGFPQTIPERYGSSRPLRFRGEVPLRIGELRDRFAGVNEFRIRLTARDGRPAALGGPGTGHSDWIRIRIEQNAPSLARQELRTQREEARKAIEEAIRDSHEAKQQANRAEHEMRKENPGKDAAEAVEKAAEKLASSEKTAEEAADELKDSLHAGKSDELEAAAEILAEARERIENAPLQESPEERGNQLRKADQEIQQAIVQLEKARDAIERDQQRAEDTVALQELADEQAELARQAEANQRSEGDAAQADHSAEPDSAGQEVSPPKPWSEHQAQVARELQQEVAERADAKASSLEAQAEKARELAQQAETLAKDQDELARQSEQAAGDSQANDSPSAETLAELQETQAEAAAELAEQVESLPATESNPAAQQASQAAKQAAQSSNEAAEKIAEASDPATQNAIEQGKPADAEPQSSDSGESANQESPSSSQSNKNAPSESMTPEQQAAAKSAAPLNQQAAGQLAKTAEALRQAAEQLEQAAENASTQAAAAAQQPAPQGQAAAPAEALAEALSAASSAATTSDAGKASEQSAAAAQALAQAAQAAQQAMRGESPAQPAQAPSPAPGGPEMPGTPPEESTPMADFRQQGADPGVPPELAKLGISAADWERIKATLAADVGSSEAEGIPTEYRSLVKDYFQNLSKTPSDKP